MGNYEFDGEKYKKFSNHQKEWGNKIIGELDIKEDNYILDLGCGDGILTNNISSIASKGLTVGIDASKGMIKCAKNLECDNLKFMCMDINNINLNEKFDLIFSNAALHWVKDHNKLLKTYVNLLNKDGQIRFNFAAQGNCKNFFYVVKRIIKLEEFKEYFTTFEWPWYMPSIDEYKSLINGIEGFKEIKVYAANADRYFNNEEELIGWIDQPSIVPFLEYLPEDKKMQFRQKVIDEMLKLTKQEDGRCFEEFKRINVCAKRK